MTTGPHRTLVTPAEVVTAEPDEGAATTPPTSAPASRKRFISAGVVREARAVGGVAVMVVGFFVPSMISSANGMTVVLDGVLLGLSALSVGFLLNLLGWVSFGGAAFSGAAAYAFAILCTSSGLSLMPSAILAVVASTIFAVLIGLVFIRGKALVFTMLTLALGQLLLQLVSLTELSKYTGAANGILVSGKGSFFGLDAMQTATASSFWPVAWAAVVLAVLACWLIGRARFGRVLRGIRENESRMQHAGYNTYLPKLAAFAFAGLMGSVGGVLQAVNISFVSPDILSFGACGTAIIAAIVGGFENPFGPILGGVLMIWAQNQFGSTGQLFLYTGIAVIVVLVLFPRGISGLLSVGWSWCARRAAIVVEGRRARAGD